MSSTPPRILVLDQGTTSSRAVVYDERAQPLAIAQRELAQSFPRSGWVEHDAEEIWQDTLACAREALQQATLAADAVAALGITNQRETIVLWDRATGQPLHPALVWQDRRTADVCARLRKAGHEPLVQERTGLLLDPYFSATKLAWLLDQVPQARARAKAGELAAGTIDSWLIFRLTDGAVHATDATNASRTLLCGLESAAWDEELLALFDVPRELLPEIRDSVGDFGSCSAKLLGAAIPICGVAGDQQAAAFGQGVRAPGTMKSTYGTGCFTLAHTGTTRPRSAHRLLATIACRRDGVNSYAIEGSIFQAGTVVQWLRDQLGLIRDAAETEALLAEADPDGDEVLVPAFTGMGAPWWDPHARGALFGLTRDSGRAQIVRAALASVAWQTLDLVEATGHDVGGLPQRLRVDGGMARNDGFLQLLADTLQMPVERPADTESTALGAALLAGLGAGVWQNETDLETCWRSDREFTPSVEPSRIAARRHKWRRALEKVLDPMCTNPVTPDNPAC
ncbi:MAG: glycerol kinase [Planctomycetes bacterium]|nr:glycerol kinase [Planctomycetota bacterium]